MIELPVHQKKITPTDLSQYIRLDRCERFLRLRLHESNEGRGFLKQAGVTAEAIPAILTRSGLAFEQAMLAQIALGYKIVDFSDGINPKDRSRTPDNVRFIEQTRSLAPGETVIVAQPRLEVDLQDWNVRGDADLIRLSRAAGGALRLLIVDMKSSAHPRVEHRLQVCFYQVLIERLLAEAGIAHEKMESGILYRGGAEIDLEPEEEERQRECARDILAVSDALLELTKDPEAYLYEITDLVTGDGSAARRIAEASPDSLFFSLDYKCDGCLYNEFCLKTACDDRDLSLVPHLAARDKKALLGAGVTNIEQLAALKQPVENGEQKSFALAPASGAGKTLAALASTSVGSRIDELVLRAHQSPFVKDTKAPPFIPSKGHSTLPYSDATHNPNLIRIYVDAQHDFTLDRIYLLAARVVACQDGKPGRNKSVVCLADGPPDAAREAALFGRWITGLLEAVASCAYQDAEGRNRAPIHLIFWNDAGQRTLLDALGRNVTSMVRAAPAVYDFVTQLAAFDSPIATFLDAEIREHRNYPMLCQSLQAVSAFLGFDWSEGRDYRSLFRERLFDGIVKRDDNYVPRSARFNSQVPLEYAYAAWGELPDAKPDTFAAYRAVDRILLEEFAARRLEAIEHIASTFHGNHLTEKTPFNLPDLAQFQERAEHLAQALKEFVTIERHTDLGAWKSVRQTAPERRVLLGETLIVRYCEEDQEPDIAALNRDNIGRSILRERYRHEWKLAHPDAKQIRLPKDQREEAEWSHGGITFKLRVECDGLDCGLDALADLVNIKEGSRLVLFSRWTYDERLPEAERQPQTPTPKQMLYGTRTDLEKLEIVRENGVDGPVQAIFAHVKMSDFSGGSAAGFTFGTINERPFQPDGLYTLDPDPNDIYGYWQSTVVDGLCKIESGEIVATHSLYERLSGRSPADAEREPYEKEIGGAAAFLAGLDAFASAGHFHDLEDSKRKYIGDHVAAPILLVQGPPGTGKSYSTGFALLARLQAAMLAGRSCRILLSCKTHAATDVLLEGVVEAQKKLRQMRAANPVLADTYFDRRLLNVPLYRLAGRGATPAGVTPLPKEADRAPGSPRAAEAIAELKYCCVAATPGGIYNAVKAVSKSSSLFGHGFCDLLVLDEASQMGLPEAMIASLPMAPDARLIVVGDPRQMPPIVKHDWESEPRRTFQQYRAYRSLFETLAEMNPPTIKFAESFRLHKDMAAFLRQEIYERDGIPYHSQKRKQLKGIDNLDAFVNAVLDPTHPLVVVVHHEEGSQSRNAFEQTLITPILEALADPNGYNLDARDGLGVVVPHRAQRIALRQAFPGLTAYDPDTGEVIAEGVDTVERYQGAEREVILVSATESDPQYLHASAAFLLDPNRLTVALSRAKTKMVLVASRSIFTYFSADEQLFANSQIWKNLLRRTCTQSLWSGERAGNQVSVWGGGSGLVV